MFTKIMVPLDASALAEQALPTAGAIAAGAGAELRLVFVHPPIAHAGYPDAPWNSARSSMERAYLDGKARELETKFGIRVIPEQVTGAVTATLCTVAYEERTELIVMATHGRTGVNRAWLGSVADTLVRSLDVPVLMLRETEQTANEPASFHRVMIPLDGSSRAESIIDAALALAGCDATYIITRVAAPVPLLLASTDGYGMIPTLVDPLATEVALDEAKKYVKAIAGRLAEQGARSLEQVVSISEDPASVLLDAMKARHVDLVAMGTHGRGASRFMFGSVVDTLLQRTTTPLLVCRGEEDYGADW